MEFDGSMEMPKLVAGRRVLVTGAASGIGRAVARAFEQAGGTSVGLDRRAVDGAIAADVTDEIAVARAFDRAEEGGPLTDVVHAAGIVEVGTVEETSVERFRNVLEVNLVGSFIVAREAARRLPRGGTLVFVSSQAGLKAGALWSSYSASKAGVLRLGEALVGELAERGVRVNSVLPGNVATPMAERAQADIAVRQGRSPDTVHADYLRSIPAGRFAEPEEIGRAVVALCSGLLSYANGLNLVLDGGEMWR
ncbi:MAG: SDR family oxidoreductase [Rhodobacteraceae bacterium]|nr:SDR family oxidoreductase [Paracoccaceae bacterium]